MIDDDDRMLEGEQFGQKPMKEGFEEFSTEHNLGFYDDEGNLKADDDDKLGNHGGYEIRAIREMRRDKKGDLHWCEKEVLCDPETVFKVEFHHDIPPKIRRFILNAIYHSFELAESLADEWDTSHLVRTKIN